MATKLRKNQVRYYAPGDGRTDANLAGQESQLSGERELRDAFAKQGIELLRMHPEMDDTYGHGFIQDLAQAMDIFGNIDKNDPIIAFLTQWSFNDRTGPLLWQHNGKKAIASNFDGHDPGLVGAASLNSVAAMHEFKPPQQPVSFFWSSERFQDPEAQKWMGEWVKKGTIDHSALLEYKHPFKPSSFMKNYGPAIAFGERLAKDYQALLAVYDNPCMGMLNAALGERDVLGTGIFLARQNQVELFHDMQQVPKELALSHMRWKMDRGYDIKIGLDNAKEITEQQLVQSGQMYEAVARRAKKFRFDGNTIAFQTGMNPVCTSSDDPEATGNSVKRPPIIIDGEEFKPGRAFRLDNEADIGMAISHMYHERLWEAAGLDAKMAEFLAEKAGYQAAQQMKDPRMWVTTAHDVRWGDMTNTRNGPAYFTGGKPIADLEAFVFALNLSGNMPVEHTQEAWSNPAKPWSGFKGSRQNYKYFPQGGICTEGVARPGEMVWSRVYKIGNELCMDIGRAGTVTLEASEQERIWSSVSRNWPLCPAILYGVSRDALMAGHMSNHISVIYAPNAISADIMMVALASFAHHKGFDRVNICGDFGLKNSLEYKAAHDLPVHGPYVRTAK